MSCLDKTILCVCVCMSLSLSLCLGVTLYNYLGGVGLLTSQPFDTVKVKTSLVDMAMHFFFIILVSNTGSN